MWCVEKIITLVLAGWLLWPATQEFKLVKSTYTGTGGFAVVASYKIVQIGQSN